MITPEDRPREIIFDHAIVHESSPDATLKYLEAKETNSPDDSPAFVKMYGSKTRCFNALIEVAERLVQERKLGYQPKFLFPVISSLGFMHQDMTQLMKL